MPNSPHFHPGELAVQKRADSPDAIHKWAQHMLKSYLDEQHRLFFSQLPFVVIAATDGQGRPWASLLCGEPGFACSPDAEHLEVEAQLPHQDPLFPYLNTGKKVGVLGIELHSRRRNRLNGLISSKSTGKILIRVEQSYGNCPRYITARAVAPKKRRALPAQLKKSKHLGEVEKRLIQEADTFFIGSGAPAEKSGPRHGLDISHRGGEAGFVRISGSTQLTIPDYAGNNLFNTLGNLELDERAALVFIDFNSGALLHLTGSAQVDWHSPDIAKHPGAKRLLRFTLDEMLLQPGAFPYKVMQLPPH